MLQFSCADSSYVYFSRLKGICIRPYCKISLSYTVSLVQYNHIIYLHRIILLYNPFFDLFCKKERSTLSALFLLYLNLSLNKPN